MRLLPHVRVLVENSFMWMIMSFIFDGLLKFKVTISAKYSFKIRREMMLFYSGKDLHEASKVCQGKRVPWDLITLQSHIFCHPIREIYAIWPKWFWKLTKIVREIKLMRTCVELSEGQHRKASAPPEWLPAKKPIMRKRATKKLRLITKKSSGWNKLAKLCRCNIRVSFALEKF